MSSRRALKARGQALVEFSLIIVLLSMILMGIFDLGRIMYTNASLSNSAREGARVAAVTGNPNAIQQATIATGIGLGIQTGQISINYFKADGSSTANRDEAATAKVGINNYPFAALTPFVGIVFGGAGTLNLNSSASMTIEKW